MLAGEARNAAVRSSTEVLPSRSSSRTISLARFSVLEDMAPTNLQQERPRQSHQVGGEPPWWILLQLALSANLPQGRLEVPNVFFDDQKARELIFMGSDLDMHS